MAAAPRFRRSRHVICSWEGAAVTLRNYATGTYARGPAAFCEIVAMCERWRSLGAIVKAVRSVPPEIVPKFVNRLVDAGILHRSDRDQPAAEQAMTQLAPWNPEAGFFHTATKDVRFTGPIEGVEAPMNTPPKAPPPVKRYRGAPFIALPKPPRDGQFPEVLLARRTWRRFKTQAVPLDDLSLLLDLTAGIQHWALNAAGQRSALKTSPSGGARHPIDVYVVALRVGGLRRGLYHYAADRHRLDRLRDGVHRDGVGRYLPRQYWYGDAAALVLFAASFERQLYRYRYSRAYRAALVEAGHLCQTFCLTATWRGLAPFCSIALADSTIERDLGLDGIRESVLYAAGVGVPDGGMEAGFAPRDVTPAPVIPNPTFTREQGLAGGNQHGSETKDTSLRSRHQRRRAGRDSRATG
jgi:SagB-type dehydrogenase family enzyme